MPNTKNWKDVPMPPRVDALPRDDRGFPIPFIILRDESGKPHFKINDMEIVLGCVLARRCAICSEPLGDDMWTLGGVLSAFHPHGIFNDTPIHHDCGTYALKVCPHLAYTQYVGGKRDDFQTTGLETHALVDPTLDPTRPPFFVFAKIADFKITTDMYIKPQRPYLEIEYWNDGEQIAAEQAFTLLIVHNEKLKANASV